MFLPGNSEIELIFDRLWYIAQEKSDKQFVPVIGGRQGCLRKMASFFIFWVKSTHNHSNILSGYKLIFFACENLLAPFEYRTLEDG